MSPVAFPAKAGRPKKGRVKGAIEIVRNKFKKKKKANKVAADGVATPDVVWVLGLGHLLTGPYQLGSLVTYEDKRLPMD